MTITSEQMIEWKIATMGMSRERAEFENETGKAYSARDYKRVAELNRVHPEWMPGTYSED